MAVSSGCYSDADLASGCCNDDFLSSSIGGLDENIPAIRPEVLQPMIAVGGVLQLRVVGVELKLSSIGDQFRMKYMSNTHVYIQPGCIYDSIPESSWMINEFLNNECHGRCARCTDISQISRIVIH